MWEYHHGKLTRRGMLLLPVTRRPQINKRVLEYAYVAAGLNIDLSAAESGLRGRTFQWPDSGLYFTGLEVFHSLHCLVRVLYPISL
jgi:hypothetical protein